jgi:predicted benzoate:H+ symporter BenE
MILLGTLLGITAEWWGVIIGVAGVTVSIIQAVRKRRAKKAESSKP